VKILYLSLEHIHAIHDTMIEEFGGSFGVRDRGLVESCARQPIQSFGGEDLYPSLFDKAATYALPISENQPFIDGNKRTAATVAAAFLDINGYEIDCSKGQIYEVMMDLANKRLTRENLSRWFQKHSKKKSAKRRARK
jgi:death on curing protein